MILLESFFEMISGAYVVQSKWQKLFTLLELGPKVMCTIMKFTLNNSPTNTHTISYSNMKNIRTNPRSRIEAKSF